jgi:lantibiotic modifying enzyme
MLQSTGALYLCATPIGNLEDITLRTLRALREADAVWAEWDGDVWCQNLRGKPAHVLGAAHGFAGNVYALSRAGGLLSAERRAEMVRRTIEVVEKHARRADGLLQWPETLEWPYPGRPLVIRTQWCHGAPGLVTSLATLAPSDDRLTELLVAAGELTWRAGPVAKGAGLCHGTAGNGYAFLKLLERTGDELWLQRARTFAMHALGQVEQARAQYGRGRFSLWTGDPGVAVYVASCVAADAAMATLDEL